MLDPIETLHALEDGHELYHWYFIRKWNRSLVKKQAAWPEHHNFEEFIRLISSLRDKTAEMVAKYTQFASLNDYLNGYAITGISLSTLSVERHDHHLARRPDHSSWRARAASASRLT